jgi:hypothetical protein
VNDELSLPAVNGLFLLENGESDESFDLPVLLPNEGFPAGRPRFGEDESRKADLPVPAERPRPALPLPADGRLLSLLRINCFLNRQRYTFVECQLLKYQSVTEEVKGLRHEINGTSQYYSSRYPNLPLL